MVQRIDSEFAHHYKNYRDYVGDEWKILVEFHSTALFYINIKKRIGILDDVFFKINAKIESKKPVL